MDTSYAHLQFELSICCKSPLSPIFLLQYLPSLSEHPIRKFSAKFPLHLPVIYYSSHKIHRKHLSPILLREIIEAMLFIESVIRPHAPLHLPDQIAEDLQTAHTIKEFFGGLYLRVII